MIVELTPLKINNPHDKAFKSAMSDTRVAREFFELYLPEKIKKLVNLSVLQLQQNTFIDEKLKKTETDLLYKTQFNLKNEQPGYLYLLTEHQSIPDRWLPLRLLRYLCSVFELHRQQNPHDKYLPPVVPLIFYTGQSRYTFSTDCFDLFGDYAALARNLLIGPYPLVELNKISDDEILSHPWSGLLELVMKHAKQRDFLDCLKRAFEHFIQPLLQESGTDNYITGMLKYSLIQGEVTDLDQCLEIMRELPDKMGKEIMTIAELLHQRGLEQGIQQGVQQGMQQGMQQGEALILIEQLEYRFGSISLELKEKIQKANHQMLSLWSKKIFSAKIVTDLFD